MPTITQKTAILAVPCHPAVSASGAAVAAWNQQVDALFATFVTSRAARSLREAEEAQLRGQMHRVHSQPGQDDAKPPT